MRRSGNRPAPLPAASGPRPAAPSAAAFPRAPPGGPSAPPGPRSAPLPPAAALRPACACCDRPNAPAPGGLAPSGPNPLLPWPSKETPGGGAPCSMLLRWPPPDGCPPRALAPTPGRRALGRLPRGPPPPPPPPAAAALLLLAARYPARPPPMPPCSNTNTCTWVSTAVTSHSCWGLCQGTLPFHSTHPLNWHILPI
jgi:hypothetical protein